MTLVTRIKNFINLTEWNMQINSYWTEPKFMSSPFTVLEIDHQLAAFTTRECILWRGTTEMNKVILAFGTR